MKKKRSSVNPLRRGFNRATKKVMDRGLKTTRTFLKPEAALKMDVFGSSIKELAELGKQSGFRIERGKDFGNGPIDLVWSINSHPALAPLMCGFIRLRADETGSSDLDDGQFSLRKISEAMIRGLRSGLDRLVLVCDNKDLAKSVQGRVEWLSSFGSLLRFDKYAHTLFPGQRQPLELVPSQKRVLQGEKIRKEKMREREEKFQRYNRPTPKRLSEETTVQKLRREVNIDTFSRPKHQKKKNINELP